MTSLLTDAPEQTPAPARRPALRVRKDGLEMPRGRRWWQEVGWRHAVGLAGVAFAGFPVLYIISAAFNPLGSVATTEIIPNTFSLVNFETLLGGSKGPFGLWYLNTLVLCAVVSVAQVLLSTLAAYAFSRFRFYGRRGGLLALLLVQMFPQFLAVVALFLMIADFGRIIPGIGLNTLAGYALVLMGGALGQVWLIKGFFDSIPHELDEAARIDGAGHFRTFTSVILPLIRPVLAVTGLLVFVSVIGEYILASIFLTDNSVKTLAVGMFGIIAGDRSNNLGVFAAGSVMIALPVLLLFLYLQKFIVGGLTAGSVK
ncbi:carbohydrate ABC transporter membrane protein 2, CUT1 family [Pseudarthrobacter phenanthrenivorans Sphe3]|uniref:Carbohydrate ABC transporter membrane protein 2, CUT1 family n=1 Tax=Pseudarthrobacter phenanthrenivorans (strain DSM 18606 / JCM 16027 / LMG 23796 / Sphe3) TaxID=930171 RepID=F0M7W9_PSEPM|nr:ABC transporter permease subunit [Pseudarthrobacter phenanthrenivorans]ADX71522.1 carbohydrate ABC transporter membrane protein 2, CUT1 family [Pseudarthrobacter phenanthrenivorans Sphe3]